MGNSLERIPHWLSILSLLLLLAGCVERQPGEFAEPALGAVQVEAGYDAVRFDVQASGAWSQCGVYFARAGEALLPIAGERTETGFSVNVTGLEDDVEYCWRAFVGNGRMEVSSEEARVSTVVTPYVKMPDPAFKAWIVARFDSSGDGEIDHQEAARIVEISCLEGPGARSLRGIESFPNLEVLIWEQDLVAEIDLSGNLKLGSLSLLDNQLREIDLSNNVALMELTLDGNGLTSLDLRPLKVLRRVDASRQPISTLLLPESSRLEELGCGYARLTDLDISAYPRLTRLFCSENSLSSLDLSANPQLRMLWCWGNDLTALDVSKLPALEDLRCAQNDFSESGLDVSANSKLRFLYCNEDRLEDIDVSANPLLEELGCYDNPLFLDLDLTGNPILDTLQVTGCPKLERVWLKTGRTVRKGVVKDEHTNVCYTNTSPPVPVRDPGFKAFLLASYDSDTDGEISRKEARMIRQINACTDEWNIRSLQGIEYMPNLSVLNCTGSWVEDPVPDQPYYYQGPYRWPGLFGPAGTLLDVDVSHNPALVSLNLCSNAGLGEAIGTLDLHRNQKLEILELGMTYLKYPDVSFLTNLTELNLSHLWGTKPDISQMTKLRRLLLDFPQDNQVDYDVDVSHCPDLEVLAISTAGSVSDLTRNSKLRELWVGNMNLHTLDVSFLPDLEVLGCAANGLTELDLSGNPSLRYLQCQENLLTVLDVSANPALEELLAAPMENGAGKNVLETLYLANGQEIPNVTVDRSEENIPAETKIVRK